jgi:Flp pilus assembly pilin Flp
MIADRRGAELVEWIVTVVIIVAIIGTSVYSLFHVIGNKFDVIKNNMPAYP